MPLKRAEKANVTRVPGVPGLLGRPGTRGTRAPGEAWYPVPDRFKVPQAGPGTRFHFFRPGCNSMLQGMVFISPCALAMNVIPIGGN